MADRLTLDVIDRPGPGVLRTMGRLAALRRRGAPGLRSLIQNGTGRFVPRPYPTLTPRRVGVLAAWDGAADAQAAWRAALGDLCA
ncbi:MAG: hypothetical protein M3P50_02710, partial [Actinomycetota bacterium]|nr:hypothetical protein [Actinomycetota bacterium]